MISKGTKPALDFSEYKPVEHLIKYKDDTYILTDASELVAAEFRKMAMGGSKVLFTDKNKVDHLVPGGGASDAQALLVSGCLFYTNLKKLPDGQEVYEIKRDRHGNAQNVPVQSIRGWASSVIKPIFELAKDISDLGEKEPEVDTRTNFDELETTNELLGEIATNTDCKDTNGPKVQRSKLTDISS